MPDVYHGNEEPDTARRAGRRDMADIEMRDAEIGHGSWDNGDVDGAGQPDATRNAP